MVLGHSKEKCSIACLYARLSSKPLSSKYGSSVGGSACYINTRCKFLDVPVRRAIRGGRERPLLDLDPW